MIIFKGAARKLSDLDLPRIGARIGVGEDEIHAIVDVESSGSGFDSQGRPKALYEPHLAYRYSTGAMRDRFVVAGLAYPNQGQQPYPHESYTRILAAQQIDETIALMATSWGLGQILGSNYKAAGYSSPQLMVQEFCASEAAQLEAVIAFIKANHLDDELQRHDWEGLARGYNGPAYAKNNYHTKLSAAFRHWQAIQDTPFDTTTVLPPPKFPPPVKPLPQPIPITPKAAKGFWQSFWDKLTGQS